MCPDYSHHHSKAYHINGAVVSCQRARRCGIKFPTYAMVPMARRTVDYFDRERDFNSFGQKILGMSSFWLRLCI